MCKDKSGTTKVADHRRMATALLTRLEGIAELRETFEVVREKHLESGKGLDEIEEMVEQEEARIRDDARALGIFADEYECDCGCEEGKDLGYEDEEKPRDAAEGHPEEARTAKAPTLAAVVFGAIGVACSMISLALRPAAPPDRE
jgi:hypothetical protein